jgi:hypothetical protein
VIASLVVSHKHWTTRAAEVMDDQDAYYYPWMAVGWIVLLLCGGLYCIIGHDNNNTSVPRKKNGDDTNEQWFRRQTAAASGSETTRFTGPARVTTTTKVDSNDLASFYREMANNPGGRRR